MGRYAGHYGHFLERLRRISDEQMEFAMSLYYDSKFVRHFLETCVPPEHDRVAVAIEDEPGGPHLVLSRDGGFVTCLAAGMTTGGLHILQGSKMRAIQGLCKSFRESMQRLGGRRRPEMLFRHKSYALSREEFSQMNSILPILIYSMGEKMLDLPDSLQARRRRYEIRFGENISRFRPRDAERVEEYWQDFFVLNHMTMVVAENRDYFTELYGESSLIIYQEYPKYSWREMMLGPSLRSLWCSYRLNQGRPVDEFLDTLEELTVDNVKMKIAELILYVYAHPKAAVEILEAVSERAKTCRGKSERLRQLNKDIYTYAALMVRLAVRDQEKNEAIFLELCQEYYRHHLLAVGRRAEDVLGPPEELTAMQGLSIATTLIDHKNDYPNADSLLYHATSLIADATVEDLYPPAEFASTLIPWTPQDGAYLFANHAQCRPRATPARVEETPGRNDPCPCASGQKYKRCCLLQEA